MPARFDAEGSYGLLCYTRVILVSYSCQYKFKCNS